MGKDFEDLIVMELQAINRRLEKMEDSLDNEMAPIKKHVTQVRFMAGAFCVLAPLALSVVLYFS